VPKCSKTDITQEEQNSDEEESNNDNNNNNKSKEVPVKERGQQEGRKSGVWLGPPPLLLLTIPPTIS